jgi:hypothetical protein
MPQTVLENAFIYGQLWVAADLNNIEFKLFSRSTKRSRKRKRRPGKALRRTSNKPMRPGHRRGMSRYWPYGSIRSY